ncbi:hypothetical protein KUTeg_007878 [Tegillarca granosa]|uniref:Fibronectin type-III domain-containing protein n=1 Tax=Tegillarca granosa TaxID=220873 RepID=A0ABQ9FEH7_TEGGR|nr:hypothetical protein KUTeg_007878 [Tegillarca granosa]
MECVGQTTQTCKCKTGLYYYGGTCTNNQIANLKVLSLQVRSVSQTQIRVEWNLPAHVSAINRFEVLWTGNAIPVPLSSSTTNYIIINLTPGKLYNVLVTSVDTTSRLTEQKVNSNQVKTTTVPLKNFDEACSSTVKCDGSKNLECNLQSVCKCKEKHYYDGTTCSSTLSDLKALDVRATMITTSSINFTWTNPTANSAIESKQVRWTGTSSGSNNVTVTATSTNITGLTPGGSYTTIVVSIDTNSRNKQQEVPSDGVPVTTKPAVPGKIESINPDNNGKQVSLSWIASAGVVTSYRVVFEGGNGDTRTQDSSNNSIAMTSLTPGRRYNITITAKSGSMTSDPRYNNTRTTVTVPDAPTNLTCISVMDTNVTLGWTPPVNPNGDIMYYIINVISGPGSQKTVNTTKPVQKQELDNLKEDSYYSFTVSARNDLYDGPASFSATCKTKPGYHNLSDLRTGKIYSTNKAVENGLTNLLSISFLLKPNLTIYAITGAGVGYSGAVTEETNEEGFYERSTILTNLEEYWQYVINIKASTNKGQSAMKTVKPEKTKPAAPGKIANFMVSRPEGNYKSATVTWSIPSLRDQNSLITSYEFKHNATGTVASKILSQSVNNGDGFTESIKVEPENYYYIEVYAINNQNQTGVKSSELYYAPPGPPPKLDSSPDIKMDSKYVHNLV